MNSVIIHSNIEVIPIRIKSVKSTHQYLIQKPTKLNESEIKIFSSMFRQINKCQHLFSLIKILSNDVQYFDVHK